MAARIFKIKIEGRIYEAEVEEIGGNAPPSVTPATKPLTTPPAATQPVVSEGGGNAVTAPMPGKIISVSVSKGQQIKAGDIVVILEAMKMEQEIKSSLSGTVKDILVVAGDTVRKEQTLVVVG